MNHEYHLTPRPSKYAKNKVWYAWRHYDPSIDPVVPEGKEQPERIYKSTHKKLKSEALTVAKEFEQEDNIKCTGTLENLAGDFFVFGKCPYLNWKRNLKEHTIYEHRKNLTKFILPKWGASYPAAIDAPDVEIWIEDKFPDKSLSWKNGVFNTFNIVMNELRRKRIIVQVPEFRRPTEGKRSKSADPFTREEMDLLFPADEIDLALVWTYRRKAQGKDEEIIDTRDKHGLMFGTMGQVAVHAGMRPGEIRALYAENVFPAINGIFIKQQIDSEGKVTYLKKAGPTDERQRLVKVPARTMELLVRWMDLNNIESGPIFTFYRDMVSKELLEKRFRKAIENAGIEIDDRRLVPYSCRYTYRSMIEGHADLKKIMDSMGHRGEEMSFHYLHILEDQFNTIDQDDVEEAWMHRDAI